MSKLQGFAGRAGKWAAGAVALVGAGSAMAADDLAGAVVTEISGGRDQILAIGVAVLALVALVALIRHIRSAAR